MGFCDDAGQVFPNAPLFADHSSLVRLSDVWKLLGSDPKTTAPIGGSWVKCSERQPVLPQFVMAKRYVTWDGAIVSFRYFLEQGAERPPEWGPARLVNLPVVAWLDVDLAVPYELFPDIVELDEDT